MHVMVVIAQTKFLKIKQRISHEKPTSGKRNPLYTSSHSFPNINRKRICEKYMW